MDSYDRKIIDLLELNSRASLSKLSKQVNLSKQSVSRRISSLNEKEELFSYYLIIDYPKLGLSDAVVFVSLKDKEKLNQNIKKIKKIVGIQWVAELFGEYDLGFSFFYKSQKELNDLINRIQDILGGKNKNLMLLNMIEHSIFSYSFNSKNREETVIKSENRDKSIELSRSEFIILQELSKNTRLPCTTIGSSLNISTKKVISTIKSMEKKRIILRYKLLLSFSKLGFNWGLIFLCCNFSEELDELVSELKKNPKVILISRSVTNVLLVDVLYDKLTELKEFVEGYKALFPIIYQTKILNILTIHKLESYLKYDSQR